VNRFIEVLAAQTRPFGVKVFPISPGTVKTNMSRVTFEQQWDDPDFWTEPEFAAQLIECMVSGDLDEYPGR
jgi:short-subunit dehydrogenase